MANIENGPMQLRLGERVVEITRGNIIKNEFLLIPLEASRKGYYNANLSQKQIEIELVNKQGFFPDFSEWKTTDIAHITTNINRKAIRYPIPKDSIIDVRSNRVINIRKSYAIITEPPVQEAFHPKES
jgi:uncharacterized protein YifN (PemK superfamily)